MVTILGIVSSPQCPVGWTLIKISMSRTVRDREVGQAQAAWEKPVSFALVFPFLQLYPTAWFSSSLVLWPFNIVPQVVVTPSHKIIFINIS